MLLHNQLQSSDQTSQKSADNRRTNCYTNLLHKRRSGLVLRGAIFYHRRRVPSDIVHEIGRVEIWQSLRTDSFEIAKRRLPMAMADMENAFERARERAGLKVDVTLFKPLEDDLPKVPLQVPIIKPSKEITLADAYDQYLADPTHTWTPSTREAYRTTRDMMVSIVDRDLPMKELSRTHARNLVETLRWVPRNATKLFPELTPKQTAAHARRSEGRIELISASNANAYIGNFRHS